MQYGKKSLETITRENPTKTGQEILDLFNNQTEAIAEATEKMVAHLEEKITTILGGQEEFYLKGSANNHYFMWKFTNFSVDAYESPKIVCDVEELDLTLLLEEDNHDDDCQEFEKMERYVFTNADFSAYAPSMYTQSNKIEFEERKAIFLSAVEVFKKTVMTTFKK